MAANNTVNSGFLERQQVYAPYLLEPILPMLLSDAFVFDATQGYTDGVTLNVPLMGQSAIYQRTEDENTRLQNVSVGNFTMTISEFPETADGITRKLIEDGYATEMFLNQLVPNQQSAIMQRYETVVLSVQQFQTAGNQNLINGSSHRRVASGAGNTLSWADFTFAANALDKANIPSAGRIAIISPDALTSLTQQVGAVNIAFNRDFLGVPAEGLRDELDGTKLFNGFRVYVSNFTSFIASETINGATATNAQACLFFSVARETYKPIARAWRRLPTADAYLDRDRDNMEVYRMNARFGVGLLRPQNLVVVLAQAPTGI
jgi:hypothetical protein